MSVDDYDLLLKHQGGACAICKRTCPTYRRLSVDHDHATGKVRGLLCINCNVGIGKFKDDPEVMREALKYLESMR